MVFKQNYIPFEHTFGKWIFDANIVSFLNRQTIDGFHVPTRDLN